MAVAWGAWSSNDRLRCGIEASYSPAVGAGTASVTVTAKVWLQTRYAAYEYGASTDWWITGTGAGSGTTDWSLGNMGTKQMGTITYSVNTSHSGPVTVHVDGHIHSSSAYPGTDAYASMDLIVPTRPYYVPSAETGIAGTRNSDTQATVSWTNHATTDAPYSSQTIDRDVQTGGSWAGWAYRASPTGSATNFVDTTLAANHVYGWRIRANNSAGSSAYNYVAANVYTTPGAPSGVSSVVDPGGTTITTSWTNTAYTDASVTHQIERSVNGGAYASVVTGIAQGTHQWTDPSPGAGTNQYRVASKTSHGNLVSAYTAGNSVSTIVAPLAPNQLSPNGPAVDFNDPVVLTWHHRDGGDGAAQSHYTIEKSSDGGGTWTALASATNIASANSTHTIAGGVLSNGTTYLWKVKTEGVVSAGFGPFSSGATLVGSAKPVATIDASYPPANLNTAPLELRWTYAQDQGSAQSEWEADLLTSDDATVLEHTSGTGTGSTVIFQYALVTGVTYHVRVRVKSAAGLWGDWATTSTDFALLPPAPIDTTAVYNECEGTTTLSLAPRIARENVLTNPSFETNVTGWSGTNATLSRVTTEHHVGAASMSVVTAAGSPKVTLTTGVTAAENEVWSGAMWVKGTAGQIVALSVRARDAGGSVLAGWAATNVTLTGGWDYVKDEGYVLPATTGSVDLTATFASGVRTFYLDEMQLIQEATAGTYIEGAAEVSADYAMIERRVPGGDWVILTSRVAVPTDFVDPLPLTHGTNEYRVTSISDSPSYLLNASFPVAGTDGTPGAHDWIFLSYGDGFGTTLRFQGDPKTGSSNGRKRAAQTFLGREDPVLLLGENRSTVVSAAGSLRYDSVCTITDLTNCTYDSTVREWETVGRDAGMVCFRDYTGRRLFGMLSELDAKDEQWPGIGSLSFTVTKTGFVEAYP